MASLSMKVGSEIFAAVTDTSAAQSQPVNAVRRQAVLVWRSGQGPELRAPGVFGVPADVEVAGFVDRVDDPVEVVASDGTPRRGADLVALAIEYLVRYSSGAVEGRPDIAICHPSHWDSNAVNAFGSALRRAGLGHAKLVPEILAVLARTRQMRGVPSGGPLAVYDLGGNGLSLSLADARTLAPIGPTVRNTDFGVAQADYAILRHVLALVEESAADLDLDDSGVVRQLGDLRDQCRIAKETLSTETATVIDVDLAGFADGIRLVRSELQELIRQPIEHSAELVEELLRVNGIDRRSLSAIVLSGGGGAIPLVAEFLSSRFRVPILRDQDPALTSVLGAMSAQPPLLRAASPPPTPPPEMPPVANRQHAHPPLTRPQGPVIERLDPSGTAGTPAPQVRPRPNPGPTGAASGSFPPPPPPFRTSERQPASTHTTRPRNRSSRKSIPLLITTAVAAFFLVGLLATMFVGPAENTSNTITSTTTTPPTTTITTTTQNSEVTSGGDGVTATPKQCPSGTKAENGTCVPIAAPCEPPSQIVDGVCVTPPVCEPPNELIDGVCQPPVIECPPPGEVVDGVCLTTTPPSSSTTSSPPTTTPPSPQETNNQTSSVVPQEISQPTTSDPSPDSVP
ncbi:Hsp70 family protein [Mycolicibacterium litorale]|uniref:Hsp70 protein n=1 Tax=Mycolicibacterium litorale TaxID=758802 RepID=A0AAD1IP41_9MYCO|nr:Hsp70 family protein [Mycolicibacterium litorale]TDY03401.1 Hsp70 protein [Mycolicibacterium litorale]BBY15198.1 hypothetical protein MLIT_07900 [Mycolicibacterium litorale]